MDSKLKEKIAMLFLPILRIYNFMQIKKYEIHLLDTEASLNLLDENDFSVSRFGDGEFDLINGKSLKFQKYDENLSLRLKEILAIKEENQNLKVCIPCAYKYLKDFNKKSQLFWIMYFKNNRKKLSFLLDKKYQYLDSQITRIYINRKSIKQSEKYFQSWKKIWNEKDLLIVEGEKSRFGVGNDLFANARTVLRILCPAENAFERYEKIFQAIKDNAKDKMVLIVLGPTATVLAYDLAKCGIRALDIGNMDMEYEWFLRKTSEKVNIEGKYSIEVNDGMVVKDSNNSEYFSQILCTIK